MASVKLQWPVHMSSMNGNYYNLVLFNQFK
jgi:hypothetical protein